MPCAVPRELTSDLPTPPGSHEWGGGLSPQPGSLRPHAACSRSHELPAAWMRPNARGSRSRLKMGHKTVVKASSAIAGGWGHPLCAAATAVGSGSREAPPGAQEVPLPGTSPGRSRQRRGHQRCPHSRRPGPGGPHPVPPDVRRGPRGRLRHAWGGGQHDRPCRAVRPLQGHDCKSLRSPRGVGGGGGAHVEPTPAPRRRRRRCTHARYRGRVGEVGRARRGRAWGGGRSHPQAPCATPAPCPACRRLCRRAATPTRAGVRARVRACVCVRVQTPARAAPPRATHPPPRAGSPPVTARPAPPRYRPREAPPRPPSLRPLPRLRPRPARRKSAPPFRRRRFGARSGRAGPGPPCPARRRRPPSPAPPSSSSVRSSTWTRPAPPRPCATSRSCGAPTAWR